MAHYFKCYEEGNEGNAQLIPAINNLDIVSVAKDYAAFNDDLNIPYSIRIIMVAEFKNGKLLKSPIKLEISRSIISHYDAEIID
jgi:hypothetical protein